MFKIKRIFWKRKNGKSLHMTKQKKSKQTTTTKITIKRFFTSKKPAKKKHFISS